MTQKAMHGCFLSILDDVTLNEFACESISVEVPSFKPPGFDWTQQCIYSITHIWLIFEKRASFSGLGAG
jgi:hypothetical protein